METLVDGDLASNNGGWQWSASTGVDPVPYFRIFNPYLQSKKVRMRHAAYTCFPGAPLTVLQADPTGDYIRYFVPELAKVFGDGAFLVACKACAYEDKLITIFSHRNSQPLSQTGSKACIPNATCSARRGPSACDQTLPKPWTGVAIGAPPSRRGSERQLSVACRSFSTWKPTMFISSQPFVTLPRASPLVTAWQCSTDSFMCRNVRCRRLTGAT